MTLKTIMAATFVAAMTAGAATAASWDFNNDATAFRNANGFEGTFDQVYPGGATRDGITLTAAAYIDANNDGVADDTNGVEITPFLDAGNAGLGVCSTGFDDTVSEGGFNGQSRCSTGYSQVPGATNPADPGDDNLVAPEVLKLTSSSLIAFDSIQIRNHAHQAVAGSVLISLDGTFNAATDTYLLDANGFVIGLNALGPSQMFWFTSAGTNPEVYLSLMTATQVPIPAAGLLLLGGLGGLAAMKRRKKA